MANPIHSNHITNVRQAVSALIADIDKLRALKKESDALDLGNALTEADFEGQTHLAAADITAVTGTTLGAIETLMAAGHATNLYKVKA